MVVGFVLKPPLIIGMIPLVVMVIVGLVCVVLAFTESRGAKRVRSTYITLLIIGIIMIVSGITLPFVISKSSTITIGQGYMYISSPSFGGTGNMNITSSMIDSAYVGRLGTGNLTVSMRNDGTSIGKFNVGVYTLSSGEGAYLLSDNLTDLVVRLVSGKYVIIGTEDTDAVVSAFSEYVYPVQAPAGS